MYKKTGHHQIQINPHTSSDIKRYPIIRMYFTHTLLYIKYTLKVFFLFNSWLYLGFSFFSKSVIMKTGEKFHVEKENYDRLWQSFTERHEEGKQCNLCLPCLYQTRKKELNLLFLGRKKRGGWGGAGSSTTVTANVCACSIQFQGRVQIFLISSPCNPRGRMAEIKRSYCTSSPQVLWRSSRNLRGLNPVTNGSY